MVRTNGFNLIIIYGLQFPILKLNIKLGIINHHHYLGKNSLGILLFITLLPIFSKFACFVNIEYKPNLSVSSKLNKISLW